MFVNLQGEENASQNVVYQQPKSCATAFGRACLALVPSTNDPRISRPNRLALITALFGGRAQYGAIHGWRHGRRKAPLWARELLAEYLERRRASDAQIIKDLLAENSPLEPRPCAQTKKGLVA